MINLSYIWMILAMIYCFEWVQLSCTSSAATASFTAVHEFLETHDPPYFHAQSPSEYNPHKLKAKTTAPDPRLPNAHTIQQARNHVNTKGAVPKKQKNNRLRN